MKKLLSCALLVSIAALSLACTRAEPDLDDGRIGRVQQAMPYVCNINGLTPEGECSTSVVCGKDAYCTDTADECREYDGEVDMHAVIVEGMCACAFSCDLTPYAY